MREHYNEMLQDYFNSLEHKCKEGMYEELSHVVMFQWNGKDANGLNLWIQKQGYTHDELVHQKMKVACGPWGMGREVGHFLLLLVSHHFK